MVSAGSSFPSRDLEIGDVHFNLANNGIYRYQGGDPIDTVNSWLLKGGELLAHPDTTGWGASQAGALWYNIALQCWFGWSGSAIVSFCVVAAEVDAFLALIAAPHDYGTVNPGGPSNDTFTIPGGDELFFVPVGGDMDNGDVNANFTNPTAQVVVSAIVADGVPASIGDTHTGQDLEIENLYTGGVNLDFEIRRGIDVIAFGTLQALI